MTDNTVNTGKGAQETGQSARVPAHAAPIGWSIAAAAVFGLTYGYYEWDAIRNIIELRAVLDAQQAVLSSTTFTVPWGSVIAAIIAPVLLYVIALIAGRRSSLVRRVVFLALGLTLLSCLMLSIYALAGS